MSLCMCRAYRSALQYNCNCVFVTAFCVTSKLACASVRSFARCLRGPWPAWRLLGAFLWAVGKAAKGGNRRKGAGGGQQPALSPSRDRPCPP